MLKTNIFLKSIFISSFLTLSVTCSESIRINLFEVEDRLVNLRLLNSKCQNRIQDELLYEYTNARRGMKFTTINGGYYIKAEHVTLQIGSLTYKKLNNPTFSISANDQSAQYYKDFRNAMFLHKYRMSQPRPIGIRK